LNEITCLHMPWQLTESGDWGDSISPDMPVAITQVTALPFEKAIIIYIAPIGGDGKPIPGHSANLKLPDWAYAQLAGSQTVPVLQMLQKMPEGIYGDKFLDFSKSEIVTLKKSEEQKP